MKRSLFLLAHFSLLLGLVSACTMVSTPVATPTATPTPSSSPVTPLALTALPETMQGEWLLTQYYVRLGTQEAEAFKPQIQAQFLAADGELSFLGDALTLLSEPFAQADQIHIQGFRLSFRNERELFESDEALALESSHLYTYQRRTYQLDFTGEKTLSEQVNYPTFQPFGVYAAQSQRILQIVSREAASFPATLPAEPVLILNVFAKKSA